MSDGDKHIDPRCAAMAAKFPGFRVIGNRNDRASGSGPVSSKVFATVSDALAAANRMQSHIRHQHDFPCIDYHWPYALRSAGNSSASN